MHQDVVYEMLANPILGHMVATVGSRTKTDGTRVWGDFRVLREVHGVRHCPFWAAKLNSPRLVANYRRLWDQNWSTQQSLQDFWQAGRRVGCLAFSPDGRSMVMPFGAQDTYSQECVFERGDRLYLIAFASVSSLSFEFVQGEGVLCQHWGQDYFTPHSTVARTTHGSFYSRLKSVSYTSGFGHQVDVSFGGLSYTLMFIHIC